MTSGKRDLWIMRPDGTEQRQLTVNGAVNGEPGVTPDNRYIVFTSNRTGAFQVWRMDLDGANQIPLTNGVAKTHPTISPDGKWVIYNATDDWHLWKVSIEGGEPLQLTGYIASMPSVSPDGKMIACVGRSESKHQILILPVEGGEPLKRIDYSGGSLSGTRIEWTPDGKAVIYAARLVRSTAIFRQSLDGGPPEETASFEQDELFDFGYSIDGQFLAVTRGGWQHDIVLISELQSAMKSR
jgi:TolB protein